MLDLKMGPLGLDNDALDNGVLGIGGDLYRWLKRKGVLMEAGAMHEILPHSKTGTLIRSLYNEVDKIPGGLRLTVGATAPHALVHHQGAEPHVILVTKGKSGRVLRRPKAVRHPGSAANPYLTSQLRRFRRL